VEILKRVFTGSKKTVNGSALIITIVFAIIIGILTSALILLAYYNRLQQSSEIIRDRLVRNAQSGINLLLADTTGLNTNSKRLIDLFNHQTDSVEITSNNWGLYKVGIVRSFEIKKEKTSLFMYGEMLPLNFKAAIYLADHERPLALVGKTKIIGDAFLPKAGAQIAYIDQRVYNRDSLIFGKILISEKSLPSLEPRTFEYLEQLTSLPRIRATSINETLLLQDTIVRLFDDSALEIYHKGKLILQNHSIAGNIIIHSDSLIEIDETCAIKNCILTAPVIKVKKGFKGSLQLIATDSIILEQNCRLDYPSAIVLLKTKKQVFQPAIIIDSGSIVEGTILTFADNDDQNKTAVYLREGSKVTGLVYVNGFLSLKGRIDGAVGADFFLYNTGATMYQNYLVDAEINRSELSKSFVGPSIFTEITKRKVITWLK